MKALKKETAPVASVGADAGQSSKMNCTQSIPKRKIKCKNGVVVDALRTVDAKTLFEAELPPLSFTIQSILPKGLFLLAGSPKVGKSWLSLDFCHTVATGGEIWGYRAEPKDVLYLALEDNYQRLQLRMEKYASEGIMNLHFAVQACDLQTGVTVQLMDFAHHHPGTGLIVIDTMQQIRGNANDKNLYVSDYRDMNLLREVTSRYNVTVLLVTHTRKMADPDPLNTISGSTGLVGAVDGVFLLEKEQRTSNQAKLTIANRDTEEFVFLLEFDRLTCRWLLIKKESQNSVEAPFHSAIVHFMETQDSWKGTATELCAALLEQNPELCYNSATLAKKLNREADTLKNRYAISYTRQTIDNTKMILLEKGVA